MNSLRTATALTLVVIATTNIPAIIAAPLPSSSDVTTHHPQAPALRPEFPVEARRAVSFGERDYYEIERRATTPSSKVSTDPLLVTTPESPSADPADPTNPSSAKSLGIGGSSSPEPAGVVNTASQPVTSSRRTGRRPPVSAKPPGSATSGSHLSSYGVGIMPAVPPPGTVDTKLDAFMRELDRKTAEDSDATSTKSTLESDTEFPSVTSPDKAPNGPPGTNSLHAETASGGSPVTSKKPSTTKPDATAKRDFETVDRNYEHERAVNELD